MKANTPEEIASERHENEGRGWGDFRTWASIATLILFLFVSAALIYWIMGNGWAHDWNLGQPAIAPG